jgi:hypothetical protein
MLGLSPQNTHARRVKCADPHTLCHWSNQCLNSVAHFLRSLVSKRDCQNVHGVHVVGNEICNALRKYTRFAGTCTRNNKQWPIGVQYGITLIGV